MNHRIAGKYEVLRPLGSGLAGSVYLVQHLDLKVQYALKLLNRVQSAGEALIERFKQEAEILLKFTHPGTVQLRDFGKTPGGQYYMAMDYCNGKLLSDIIAERGPFPINETLLLVEQILDVLEAAHKLGIVHRDIKPENIMLLESSSATFPQVKVLDFGISSLREGLGKPQIGSSTTVVGTPEYMAPEQISGDVELDHRVDVYSTGVIMYELLSGKVPFCDENVAKMLLMHLIQPPESIDPAREIPFLVESIAAQALRKDRADRYGSAAEFRKACEEARALLGTAPPTERNSANKHYQVSDRHNSGAHSAPIPLEHYGVKILCLDDDEMVLNILEHLLGREGFKVFSATSFSKIHNYVFDHKVDLLVSDVNMPGLNGGKVCKMIKASVPDLKVLLFSNIPERDLENLAQETAADGWLSKLTKPDHWVREISKMVTGKR